MHVELPAVTPRYRAAILVASMCGRYRRFSVAQPAPWPLARPGAIGHGLSPHGLGGAAGADRDQAYYWSQLWCWHAATDLADRPPILRPRLPITDLRLTALWRRPALVRWRKRAATPDPVAPDKFTAKLPATDAPYWVAMLTAAPWAGERRLGGARPRSGFGSVVLVAVSVLFSLPPAASGDVGPLVLGERRGAHCRDDVGDYLAAGAASISGCRSARP